MVIEVLICTASNLTEHEKKLLRLLSALRVHKNIYDRSVREIRIASSEVEGVHAVGTCTCTASYSGKSSEKLMKSASVQEANVTSQQWLTACRDTLSFLRRSSAHQGQEPIDHYELFRCNILI